MRQGTNTALAAYLLLAGMAWGTEPLWGPAADGLSMGVSLEGPAASRLLRVTFRNLGTSRQDFVIGGKTGVGSMHSFDSVLLSPDGASCKVMDATVGSVAGYVEPIVVRLAPGETQSVTIATRKMFCQIGRQTVRIEQLMGSGHRLRVGFTAKTEANAWGGVRPGWTGTLTSGTLPEK